MDTPGCGSMDREDFAFVVENSDGFFDMIKALKFINENEVYVGIPDDTTDRENEKNNEVTNADLLFIHTNGSPKMNIPARPVIEPALRKDRERISSMMKKAAIFVFDKKYDDALKQLKMVGMRGQNVSRKYFLDQDNGWKPNSSAVQRAKMKKGAQNPRPLIDTGELRKSITYFVKTKGGRTK